MEKNNDLHYDCADIVNDLSQLQGDAVVYATWIDKDGNNHKCPIYKVVETADEDEVYFYLDMD